METGDGNIHAFVVVQGSCNIVKLIHLNYNNKSGAKP